MISADRVRAIVAEIRKTPYIALYTGDWLKDPISGRSLQVQGLWVRMMMAMHDARIYGHLADGNGGPLDDKAIARQCGVERGAAEYRRLLADLDLAGVPSRSGAQGYDALFQAAINNEPVDLSPLRASQSGVIYSRRMVRDLRLKVLRHLAGQLGQPRSKILVDQNIHQTPDVYVRGRADTDTDTDQVLLGTSEPKGPEGESEGEPSPADVEALRTELARWGLRKVTARELAMILRLGGLRWALALVADPAVGPHIGNKPFKYLYTIAQKRSESGWQPTSMLTIEGIAPAPFRLVDVDYVRDIEHKAKHPEFWTRTDCTADDGRAYLAYIRGELDGDLTNAPTIEEFLQRMAVKA